MTGLATESAPIRSECRGLTDYACVCGTGAATHPHLGWVQTTQRLSDADCEELIALGKAGDLMPSTVVGEEKYSGHRKCVARRLDPSPRSAWVFELLRSLASDATSKHFLLTLTNIARLPQYLEYEAGRGAFGWHNDYSHGIVDSCRKLTIIIQLSRPEEYEGGRLQTFGIEVEELPREKGTIVVFPSLLYHQITPVTRGTRRALVAWIAGPRIT
jgi:PKHD-type hydroxylase